MPMDTGMIVVLAVAILALLGVVVLGWRLRREQRNTAALLARYHDELAELRAVRGPAAPVAEPAPRVAEFLITDAGQPGREPGPAVEERIVLSATMGEPLVKVAAFGHGLRRALSPRTLNRIRFEMRREVRRVRKQRRREMRRAWREMRADGSEEPAA